MTARYAVGIDLGTTHTAVAYVDLDAEGAGDAARLRVLEVPQLVARSAVEARALLPSFLYFAHESEGAQALPWDDARRIVVGEYARARGVDAPNRLISSAKSWLVHPSMDRRSGILPLSAPEDVEKISPVEASWRYLEHVAESWDAQIAKGDPSLALSAQDVVLTVPASFDAAARELTVEAALAAGLERATLLEEPQAAVYAWISALGDGWRKHVRPGDVLLVVDVGGGTTDFSAILANEKDGSLELERVAVGDHILLGGDNMDLALAHVVAAKLAAEGKEVDAWHMTALTHACRGAKERMLADASLAKSPIALAARGSKLLGGGIRTELTREELVRTLVEGFFPAVAADARPAVRARAALTQLGLPYAQDAAVTKHLAAFTSRHSLSPTAILFNGGVMKGEPLKERVVACVERWLAAAGKPNARVLEGADLDLAVARGAAAYGLARRGRGVRIRGGTARAYYVGIESAMPAVPGLEPPITAMCVAPFGMEEGTSAELPEHELGVVVGERVSFRFFGSTVRGEDAAGTELPRWKEGELEELAPIEITLPSEGRRAGDVVPVHLRARVTEVGTLLLEAVPAKPLKDGERWKVELSVRQDA
jgi:molecular chaperone DnaK (HSP70)